MTDTPRCPDCGAEVSGEGWSEELCPRCLLSLALEESTRAGVETGALAGEVTQDLEAQGLSPGQVLGNRYAVRTLLGRGGMGEVWRAFDLKLRVDVALKTVRVDLQEPERLLETLRQEVRAAREVSSPNVCRVYDLEELDGRELVAMEYVRGTTLQEVLRARGPLELQEAREVAAQLLAGLEAIHGAGLVHRDLKPSNVMLTPASRVVVMDFGIAKGLAEARRGTVSGTPAYMAPEQSRGEGVDARADVFSAGVVLAEMLAPPGEEARAALWRGLRLEPPQLPDSPWRRVLETAVAAHPERRFAAASALARALEEVTLRVEGAEELQPYPGLVPFTEEDREYFFGRELETEALWGKLRRHHLLALIGTSGAGKTSFLRAGLLASAPAGWAWAICTPGEAPVTALRQALAPQLSGDRDALRELVTVEDPDAVVSAAGRWRKQSKHALLVVDQLEELFTLNPPEVQAGFAALLGRLALEADLRVLLSLRDDFLVHCHGHEALKPVFSELTVLGPPTGAALRRAVVQPALKCGYRFEDEELVDGMLAEVEGERGALPLVAFCAEQLWRRRDRERGLLTREAYDLVGGVGGALAQHAELTLERVGTDRIPVVRELFRNLVTARGTRAVRDRDELLSVFESTDRQGAGEVLDALIDARLLTSYGVEGDDGSEPTQRVEVVHESLLSAWPRLVRWTAQDVEGARLRDDLRQAARRWQERDRPDDLLWVGSGYREYQLWRERYRGRLSELEEAFAAAMESLATRQRRRRRAAVTAGFAALLAVLAAVTALWRHSVLQTRRAEASKLVTLGRMVLGDNCTEALAYAIASLERADTPEARRLALRALSAGPPATMLPEGEQPSALAISPDGRTLAVGCFEGVLRVFQRDRGAPARVQAFRRDQGPISSLFFSPDGQLLAGGAWEADGEVRVWETEGWRLVRTLRSPEPPELLRDSLGNSSAFGLVEPDLSALVTTTFVEGNEVWESRTKDEGWWVIRRWPLEGGPSELIGRVPGAAAPFPSVDLSHRLLALVSGDELHVHDLDTLGDEPPRVVSRHSGRPPWGWNLDLDSAGQRLAVGGADRILRVWPLDGDGASLELEVPGWPYHTLFSPDGSRLAQGYTAAGARLWDLRGPASAEPLPLSLWAPSVHQLAFMPDSRWLVRAAYDQEHYRLALWPLGGRLPWVLRVGETTTPLTLRFHPDGSRLFTVVADKDGLETLLSWPLTGGPGLDPTPLFRGSALSLSRIAVDPRGRFLIIGSSQGVHRIPLDGGATSLVDGVPQADWLSLDPSGRHLVSTYEGVTVHDLEGGERLTPEVPGEGDVTRAVFDARGRLLVVCGGVLSRWDPQTGAREILVRENIHWASPVGSGGRLYVRNGESMAGSTRSILNLEDGSLTPLPAAHQSPGSISFDSGGSVVATAHPDGEVRVGRLMADQPHLLLGHEMGDTAAVVSPDGRWVASLGFDGTLVLWPMPDLSEPPFHTLPYDELMARLEALTNLRAVPDGQAPTGYRVEADFTAYRGWGDVPQW